MIQTHLLNTFISIGCIQTVEVFFIKSDYPHHYNIIAPYAECADGIAKPAQCRHAHSFPMDIGYNQGHEISDVMTNTICASCISTQHRFESQSVRLLSKARK